MNTFLSQRVFTLFFAFCIAFSQSMYAQSPKDNYFEISKNLEIFNSLFKELNENYVDPIEPGKNMKTAIEAMLQELDPYTVYISEDDIEDYRIHTTGKYGGIGSTVIEKDGFIVIDEPYENSPIIKAGIKSGDIIMAIDGQSTAGKSVDDVSEFLKGTPGTKIKLKIRDAFTKQESEKTVERGSITISSVPYSGMVGKDKNIGYARLTQFTQNCAQVLKFQMDSLKKINPNMQAFILDLRGNPGGLLDEAVHICNLFIPSNQLVVSTKGKAEDANKSFKTSLPPWDEKIPVAILINRGSASASEVVSGTLQDLDRAVIIGQKSFGKGLVQNTKSLSYKSQLKVTTAKYYTPSGRCIQAIDYANRNEDGSVGHIPDSLKTLFKTKKGRKVMDGGGIEPDFPIDEEPASLLLPTLVNKYFIFDYATEYVKNHPTIASASSFKLSDKDFDDFKLWLRNKDYKYETKAEKLLNDFKEVAEKENYFKGVRTEYDKLHQAFSHDKEQDLIKDKKQIIRYLQNEIVSRYYYHSGKFENILQDDKELEKAIDVLQNSNLYNKTLGN